MDFHCRQEEKKGELESKKSGERNRHFEKETDTALFFEKEMSSPCSLRKLLFGGSGGISTQSIRSLLTHVPYSHLESPRCLSQISSCQSDTTYNLLLRIHDLPKFNTWAVQIMSGSAKKCNFNGLHCNHLCSWGVCFVCSTLYNYANELPYRMEQARQTAQQHKWWVISKVLLNYRSRMGTGQVAYIKQMEWACQIK